ncbi:MAG: HAD-IB family hydrolase [Spirochaetales bacterium]|nr:HAD-IB family hydrolase [Spirochaetales bacterium]
MKIAAFFDIDGTLCRDSLMIEHFKKLLKYEVLDEAIWHDNVKYTYDNWKKRRGNYDDYLKELSEIYVESLKGLDKKTMDFVAGQVIDLAGDKVYMYTRRQIERHTEAGHLVFFISGSPDYLVHKMAGKYGVTDSIGSRYLLDDTGMYTGEVEKMWDAESKRRAILDYMKAYDIDLESSYAYGDTSGDLSMFELVGHPVAINPTHELLLHLGDREELKNKTQVVVERKDVIYFLTPDVKACTPEF